jgi:uncharacterized protein (TIGR03084 family)
MNMAARVLDDLQDEQAHLDDLLGGLQSQQWSLPTPARGWDIRDSVSHLAGADEVAREVLDGPPEALRRHVARLGGPAAFVEEQLRRGRALQPHEVLTWWRRARGLLLVAIRATDMQRGVVWGAGPLKVSSLVTGRLMETWAHGLDCFSAAGAVTHDTARLWHVCHLAYRSLPHAFRVAGMVMDMPLHQLQVQVEAPDGDEVWQLGPPDAPHRITGTAGEWARVSVHRLPLSEARSLCGWDPFSRRALAVVRAFV